MSDKIVDYIKTGINLKRNSEKSLKTYNKLFVNQKLRKNHKSIDWLTLSMVRNSNEDNGNADHK